MEAIKQDPCFTNLKISGRGNCSATHSIVTLCTATTPSKIQRITLGNNQQTWCSDNSKKRSSPQQVQQVQQDKEILRQLIQIYDDTTKTLPYDISPQLKNNKLMVLPYIQKYPDAIKHLPENLKRDPDILVAAGMLDDNHIDFTERLNRMQQMKPHQQQKNDNVLKKIVLSTRYSLTSTSRSDATNITNLFKDSPYVKTRISRCMHRMRLIRRLAILTGRTMIRHVGAQRNHANIHIGGHPTDDCCWRYSFRSQLLEARESGGFMIQVIERDHGGMMGEPPKLGMGQRIELDMANQLNVKTFHIYRPFAGLDIFRPFHIDLLVAIIKKLVCHELSGYVPQYRPPIACIG